MLCHLALSLRVQVCPVYRRHLAKCDTSLSVCLSGLIKMSEAVFQSKQEPVSSQSDCLKKARIIFTMSWVLWLSRLCNQTAREELKLKCMKTRPIPGLH